MRQSLVLTCLALGACASLKPRAECPLHGGREWREIQSEHFILKTNADVDKARETVQNLEWTREALLLMWEGRFDPPTRVDVIMLRNRFELAEFGDERVAGKMIPLTPRPVIVLVGRFALGNLGAQRFIVTHELTHYLTSFIFPWQPRWLNEGFAQFTQTMQEGLDEQTVVFGSPDSNLLKYIRYKGPLPLQALWDWDTNSPSAEEMGHYYASSWAWFYFLYNEHLTRFSRFWEELAGGLEPREAWGRSFAGVEQAALEKQLRRYLKQGQYAEMAYSLNGGEVEMTEQVLSPADVHVLRAKLFVFGGTRGEAKETEARIQKEVAMAIALDENHVEARAMRIEHWEDDPERQIAAAEKLVEDHPDDIKGWKLLIAMLKERKDEKRLEEALVSAEALDPSEPWVLAELALVRARSGRAAEARELIEHAHALAPWSGVVLQAHACVAALAGDCKEAESLLRQTLLVSPEAAHAEIERSLAPFLASCKR